MQRSTFALLAVMTLTGCPYTEGCEGVAESPAAAAARADEPGADPSGDDSASVGDGAPATGDGTPSGTNGTSGTGGGTGAAGTVGEIDFGPAPTGGPALITVACPELTMPKSAATLYVDANAVGAELGTKSAPLHTIGQAFASAQPRAVVYVAAGVYKETLVVPDKDLVVFGGFAPGFATRSNACGTVLEPATPTGTVLKATSVKGFGVEGVTIRKGAHGFVATGDGSKPGMFTIARSVFTDNGVRTEEGGALGLDSVNARVFGNVFRDNQASKGAALAGGGKVTLTIDQNLFQNNLGYSDHGGGVYLDAQTSKISRNTFRGNATGVGINGGQGGGWGGAVIVYSNSLAERARADFAYNVFTENLAGIGGAVFVDEGATITMSHDLLYKNRAYPENGFLRGAAIYVDGTGFPGGGSTFTGEYLTVVNNVYDDKGNLGEEAFGGNVYVEGYSSATFTSSVLWHNGQNPSYVEAGANLLTISSSIAPTQCTSANGVGFVTASAAICKIGAGVSEPASLIFGNEAGDDYRIAGMNIGAFAP